MAMKLKIYRLVVIFACFGLALPKQKGSVADRCFCKLQGEIDDCSCKVESIDSLNNQRVYPILQSLLGKDYFRYFKVNLNKGCRFWSDDNMCALRDCHVKLCDYNDVPEGLKGGKPVKKKTEDADCEEERELSALDKTLSEKSKEAFKNWKEHDDLLDTFCEIDDENSAALEYVDLLLNPERYTGYAGESAHKIWSSIYEENCFKPDEDLTYGPGIAPSRNAGMCLEKRAFYRMVSGLHSSINIHLSARYRLPGKDGYGTATWGHHLKEFKTRFDPETTNGEGPQWLKNLYFTYLVELRALAKAAPYFEKEDFYTGNTQQDIDVREGMKSFLKVVQEFPDHFEESNLFKDNSEMVLKLKEEFRNHFLNISRIMDCVGCDKCRLWGKLQVTGMGTALKILFSGDSLNAESTVDATHKDYFQLRRTEIVALFNAFGRLSTSIKEVDNFRKMLKQSELKSEL